MTAEATACLREDHRRIQRVLARFDAVLIEHRSRPRVDGAVLRPFLDFFERFAEAWHNGREERCLFPCLRRCAGTACAARLDGLLEEHARARHHVRMMRLHLDDAVRGDALARELFLEQARRYRDLMAGHVPAEDGPLFALADRAITGDALVGLLRAYDAFAPPGADDGPTGRPPGDDDDDDDAPPA